MKHNPHAVTTAIQLYFSGESLRNTQKSIRLLGVRVSHQTIYNWIEKYVHLMQTYVEKLKPNVGDIWRADELWVKVKGDMKYLFALMDDETRYLIAQEVLILLLYDKHERLVPDIMEWQLKEDDINKDIRVSDYFHDTGTKIQVKHLDQLFGIYIKSMGKDTVCRLEERKYPTNKPAIEFINETFNPMEKVEKQLEEIIRLMTQ
jgi:hypothetical protein